MLMVGALRVYQSACGPKTYQTPSSYSGDTKPCQNLVDAGSGSTLLIHEATMADDQVIMAAEKAHSTVGQAMEVARRFE